MAETREATDGEEKPRKLVIFAWSGDLDKVWPQLILATIAQRYQLCLVPGHPVEPQMLVTLRPKYGLRMTIHRR